MDNEAACEVEGDLGSILRARRIAARTCTDRAEDAERVAKGSLDPANYEVEENENTPLIRERTVVAQDTDGLDWPAQTDLDGLPWWKRPSVLWLLPFFTLFALSFGGIIVPRFNIINNLICRDYYLEEAATTPASLALVPSAYGGDNPQCMTPEVEARVTLFNLGLNLIDGILGMLTSAKLGSLSDRYGRNRILGLITLGGLVNMVFLVVAASYPDTFNPYWLYVGCAVDGMAGSFIAALAVSHAYASDCTHPNQRNVAFGYFHVCLFGGIALGPILTGFIVKKTNSQVLPFWLATGSVAIFVFSITFLVPESLPKHRQLAAREKFARQQASKPSQVSPWASRARAFNLFEPLHILWPTGPGSSPALRRNLVLLAAIDAIMFGVAMGLVNVILAYTKVAFKWDVLNQSVGTSIINMCRTFWLFVFLPLVTRLARGSASSHSHLVQKGCDWLDLALIRSAVLFDFVGYLGYAFSPTGALFIFSGCVASMGGIGSPTLQSALTKHVPHDRVGQVLGTVGLLHAFARVVGPTTFSAIFSKTVKFYPPAVFLCLASAFFLAAILSWFVRPGVFYDEDSTSAHENEERERQDAADATSAVP